MKVHSDWMVQSLCGVWEVLQLSCYQFKFGHTYVSQLFNSNGIWVKVVFLEQQLLSHSLVFGDHFLVYTVDVPAILYPASLCNGPIKNLAWVFQAWICTSWLLFCFIWCFVGYWYSPATVETHWTMDTSLIWVIPVVWGIQ